jgi:hypothetical protein
MNDPRNRERLRRALEAIEQVSADCQSALNARASATLQQNPGPIGIGRIIALARQADTLERCARELYDILDQPPGNPTVTITEAA